MLLCSRPNNRTVSLIMPLVTLLETSTKLQIHDLDARRCGRHYFLSYHETAFRGRLNVLRLWILGSISQYFALNPSACCTYFRVWRSSLQTFSLAACRTRLSSRNYAGRASINATKEVQCVSSALILPLIIVLRLDARSTNPTLLSSLVRYLCI